MILEERTAIEDKCKLQILLKENQHQERLSQLTSQLRQIEEEREEKANEVL